MFHTLRKRKHFQAKSGRVRATISHDPPWFCIVRLKIQSQEKRGLRSRFISSLVWREEKNPGSPWLGRAAPSENEQRFGAGFGFCKGSIKEPLVWLKFLPVLLYDANYDESIPYLHFTSVNLILLLMCGVGYRKGGVINLCDSREWGVNDLW